MSGIYIKGMEMPTNCSECAFCGYYGNGEHMCDIIQEAVEYESAKMSRLDDCPLAPVPEHGRLIDGDKVFKRLQKQAMSVWGDGNPRYQIVLDVMDAIRFAPTIIEAEEGE